MKAKDLDSTPITFTDEEALGCKKSIESLQRLLTDAQREERGLPTGLHRGTARTKKSAQDKAAAAAAAGQGAQDSVRRRAAAETSDDSSAVLHVHICSYFSLDIYKICLCSYLFISDLACLYNRMFISGYKHYICLYQRHI